MLLYAASADRFVAVNRPDGKLISLIPTEIKTRWARPEVDGFGLARAYDANVADNGADPGAICKKKKKFGCQPLVQVKYCFLHSSIGPL